jgi:transcriptional regulator with XRE-family HTH domain
MRKAKQHNHSLLSHLGDAIRNRRVDIGITQQELAAKTELHRTYITDIESGHRNISMLTYNKLTDALMCAGSLPLIEAERSMALESAPALFGVKGGLSKASLLLHLSNEFCFDLDIVALEMQVKANMSKLQVAVESYSRKHNAYPRDEKTVGEALNGLVSINPFTTKPETISMGSEMSEELAIRVAGSLRPGEIEYSPINKGAN